MQVDSENRFKAPPPVNPPARARLDRDADESHGGGERRSEVVADAAPNGASLRTDRRRTGPRRRAAHKMQGDTAERLLDVHEAAAMLSVAPATLYKWAYERRLPVVKLFGPRGALRFRLSVIEKLIAESDQPTLRSFGD